MKERAWTVSNKQQRQGISPMALREGSTRMSDDETSYRTTRLSDVVPERVDWLWPGRIPLGKITMLDGDPGVGKSTLATTIAAHVTSGKPWPDNTDCPLGAVLMLSGEDGLADTVRPRFDATGFGDPSRFYVMDSVQVIAGDDTADLDPDLSARTPLEQAITDCGATLLIVDVLMAFLPVGVDSHKDQHIRTVLKRLADITDRTGCAMLLLRHLNKGSGGNALYRGSGSIGIVGAARSGLLVAKDPDEDGLIVLASTKSNLSIEPPSLSYRLTDSDNGAGHIVWGHEVERTAQDLLSADDSGDRQERHALADFIRDYLTDNGGQHPAADCQKAVRAAFGQVAKSTEKRARDRAGVITKRVRDSWVWELGST